MRWLRTDHENLEASLQEEPRDNSVLSYGRYCTWTYLEGYNNHPDYCTWTLQAVNFDRGSARESTRAMQHFARYLFMKNNGRAPRPGQDYLEGNAPRRTATAQPAASSRGRAPGTSGGPMAVHLPEAEMRLEDIPLHIPNQESTSDRRRTFAEASAAHDAVGDAAMVQIGQETWEFPREPSPPSFGS